MVFFAVAVFLFCFVLFCLTMLQGLQDLSSPNRIESVPLQCKRGVLTTVLPGKSPQFGLGWEKRIDKVKWVGEVGWPQYPFRSG